MLLLRNPRRQQVRVGRLGRCDFLRGWYLYVGSAFGPGGVAARCAHHQRVTPRPRWHIDYLRAVAYLRQIWYSNDPQRREHQWAELLGEVLGLAEPIRGFGSSDCDCGSHLFISAVKPDWRAFARLAGERLGVQQAINCEYF